MDIVDVGVETLRILITHDIPSSSTNTYSLVVDDKVYVDNLSNGQEVILKNLTEETSYKIDLVETPKPAPKLRVLSLRSSSYFTLQSIDIYGSNNFYLGGYSSEVTTTGKDFYFSNVYAKKIVIKMNASSNLNNVVMSLKQKVGSTLEIYFSQNLTSNVSTQTFNIP